MPIIISNTLATKKKLIAVAVTSALLLGGWQALNRDALARVEPTPVKLSGMPSSFADLVQSVEPAVVNISTTGQRVPSQAFSMPRFQFPPGSPFEDFFKRNVPQGPDRGPTQQALGSGFVIDSEGYVVTNHHVIDGADKITVILNDGTRYPAELKGADPKTDLALLKIDPEQPLSYVSFGDSDQARVGDWVIAIGNPFGLGGSVTTGIVSARGRDIHAGPFDDFLQIDAPINRGNSGGPVFDTEGKVIGINTAIYSPNGGSVGIGFAIPANLAEPVIHQLRNHGQVERGWLGVQIQDVTEEIADSLGLEEHKGALVASVVPNSPADKADIRPGDVILRFNGQDVERMKDLPRIVAAVPAQDQVKVSIWRSGKTRNYKVTIASMPADGDKLAANIDNSPARLGLSLASLTPEHQRHYHLDRDAHGVLIVAVEPDSPAARKGLRPGDLIVQVGQQPVDEPSQVIDEVKRTAAEDRNTVLLLIDRRGAEQFVAVKIA